jgi:sugar/nucleoside kinase (ribokinase family)
MTSRAPRRRGIASGGNWVVDRVKQVDALAGRGMLANIRAEHLSTGGAPANVLADLALMRSPFPLDGVGIVGDDADGRFIIEKFRKLGVDVSRIRIAPEAPTSHTDVFNDERSGDRAFYHQRGANALFGPDEVPIRDLDCRIFHLGYILLLDSMDQPDRRYGTAAARLLAKLQKAGILTSVDVVSEEGDRFRTFVPPALKYVDYLIINDTEAARSVGMKVRGRGGKLDGPALADAVDKLYEFGDMQLVAVHMPEGAYARTRDGRRFSRGSLDLPGGFIAGAVGAGDAFCAGVLYGLHEGWTIDDTIHLGSCCAAASLSAPGATEGVRPLKDVLSLGKRFPERAPPVKL